MGRKRNVTADDQLIELAMAGAEEGRRIPDIAKAAGLPPHRFYQALRHARLTGTYLARVVDSRRTKIKGSTDG